MIGVIANPVDSVVAEFFELFKTPWEPYRKDGNYEVILCSVDREFDCRAARLVLMYSSEELSFDRANQIKCAGRREKTVLTYGGMRIPIYGFCRTFCGGDSSRLLLDETSRATAHCLQSFEDRTVVRIGYDLFHEIHSLLTVGQPAEHAGIPTLDLHIALLRELIVSAGITLLEIPAVPAGYRFIACLTHDVDHASIRKHKWDHTMAGFIYRSLVVSVANFLRGAIPFRDVWTNWAAVFRLPFVYLGIAKDFWEDFVARYRGLEKDVPSTYFIIPFRDRPGCNPHGEAPPAYRASRYGADDIARSIAEVLSTGGEVGLHGIDAWFDSASAREELMCIRRITGHNEVGARMHWLYSKEDTPRILEQAGIAFDSTIGYRETVGFRAGTARVYKPLQAERLLELPMHAMDTALFYPGYLGLTSAEATRVLENLADHVESFGGCLTINWHDRSLAPERLWYSCYTRFLNDLKNRGVWFATASDVVAWYRKRRSVVFERATIEQETPVSGGTHSNHDETPGLLLRIYNPTHYQDPARRKSFIDVSFSQDTLLQVASGKSR